jgi:type II secretory pathway component PulF
MNFSSSARLMEALVAIERAAGKGASFLAMPSGAGMVRTMNPREKVRLYHELGQLVRSGTPFPKAIETLIPHTRGEARSALAAVKTALNRGATVAEALVAGAPFIAALEAGMFTASDRAGRLENGLDHASEYYGALSEARSRMWSRAAYPLFVLHIGFVALSLPVIFAPKGGVEAFVTTVLIAVAGLWLAILGGGFLLSALLSAAARNTALDRALRSIPLLGKLRRAFALSRFCAAYNLQLDAGVNVLASLEVAGRASGSAIIRAAADEALPAVRSGGKVGAALVATRAFPEPFVRAFTVGEETGQLDQELRRLADEYRQSALRGLEALADWVPKLLFLAILIYLAFRIVSFYQGYFKGIQDITGEN